VCVCVCVYCIRSVRDLGFYYVLTYQSIRRHIPPHKKNSHSHRDVVCFMWGTKKIFIYNWLKTVRVIKISVLQNQGLRSGIFTNRWKMSPWTRRSAAVPVSRTFVVTTLSRATCCEQLLRQRHAAGRLLRVAADKYRCLDKPRHTSSPCVLGLGQDGDRHEVFLLCCVPG